MVASSSRPIVATREPRKRRENPRRRIERGVRLLENALGRPRLGRRSPPLDELIITILSQNTNDRNRDRAYRSLRRRFRNWEAVLRADRGELEEAIREGGLAATKSRVIQEVLRRVKRDHGRLSLDSLRRMPLDDARRYLAGFKGVGEKTICCVLLFACGHPAFPVDTHVHRVTRRLGWVPAGATAARCHTLLGEWIPKDDYLSAHLNLITLGRSLCRPRAPRCDVCPLRRQCRFAAENGRVAERLRTRGGGSPGPG